MRPLCADAVVIVVLAASAIHALAVPAAPMAVAAGITFCSGQAHPAQQLVVVPPEPGTHPPHSPMARCRGSQSLAGHSLQQPPAACS